MKKIKVNKSNLNQECQELWGIPEFYKDEIINCAKCRKPFTFTAQEKYEWYEVQKKDIRMHPKFCPKHYDEWLFKKQLKIKMDESYKALETDQSSKTMFEAAKNIIAYYQYNNSGDLEKVRSLLKNCIENGYKVKQANKLIEKLKK